MHVGYLIQHFPPEVGAGASRASELALRWKQLGSRVTVITAMPNRPMRRIHPDYRGRLFISEDWQGIGVHRGWLYTAPRGGFVSTVGNNLSFMVTGALQALLRTRDLDVLIASSPPFFPHIAGTGVARLLGIPLVLEVRDLWPDYLVDMGLLRQNAPQTRALFALERAMLRAADAVTVVTDSFRRRVLEKGVVADRVAVIPNGVDLHRYRRGNSGRVPAHFPVRSAGETVIGYLGNFGAGQDLPTVVRGFCRAVERGLRARLVLMGGGPARPAIEAAIRMSGLGDRVTLGDAIEREETVSFYTACDACLVPLAAVPVFQETVPSKLFEIMACETPVIGCFAGEAERIVRASGAGIVAPPGDEEGIAGALLTMSQLSADRRAQMGAAGRAYVTAHYDRVALADRYAEFLGVVRQRHREHAGETTQPRRVRG